jgi:hypothetical protein
MLRKLAGPLFVSLVLAISGCASMESTPAVNMSGPPANTTGAWSGWAGMGAAAAPVSLTLTQSGANVTGDIDVGGRPDLTGPVVGTVQGNALSLKLQSGFGTLPVMTVSESQISGVISVGPMTLTRSK